MSAIEFHIPASPTPGYFSMIGMFALALKSLGPPYSTAPIHVSLGGETQTPIPEKYGLSECRERLFWHWADPDDYRVYSHYAQVYHRFHVMGDSDLICFCDADILLARPIDELLQTLTRTPALAGAMGQYSPFVNLTDRSQKEVWRELSQAILGAPIDTSYRYSFSETKSGTDLETPFYLNYGFVLAPRPYFARLAPWWREFLLKIVHFFPSSHPKFIPLQHIFAGQIALALAIEKEGLPTLALPPRYNWPNRLIADEIYPGEIPEIRVVHYNKNLDRSKLFCDQAYFERFLEQTFADSGTQLLQQRVRQLTHGQFLG